MIAAEQAHYTASWWPIIGLLAFMAGVMVVAYWAPISTFLQDCTRRSRRNRDRARRARRDAALSGPPPWARR
jgi:hypothetical protein